MPTVVYPPKLNTDYKRLCACYSLIEQMRLEHNKVVAELRSRLEYELAPSDSKEYKAKEKAGFIRGWCPKGYMLADTPANNELRAKFKSFARISKKELKLLLAEKDNLVEKIRWANYTHEQWKQVSSLDDDSYHELCETLFGHEATEKVKSTKAKSYLLDELKALNLDDMPSASFADPTEDFTTYTEVDGAGQITVVADRITVANFDRDVSIYVYDDKTANHFDGDWEFLFKFYWDNNSGKGTCYMAGVANAINDIQTIDDASGDELSCYFYIGNAPNVHLGVTEIDGGDRYNATFNPAVIDTLYYCEFERDEAVGTYGTIYLYICEDDYWDDGGTQKASPSAALHTSKKDFQYIYGIQSRDQGYGGLTFDGHVELLDLQEAVGWGGEYCGVSVDEFDGVTPEEIDGV